MADLTAYLNKVALIESNLGMTYRGLLVHIDLSAPCLVLTDGGFDLLCAAVCRRSRDESEKRDIFFDNLAK